MDDKRNRIERYIESLPNDVETPEATSALLPTSRDFNGGGSNIKICVNYNIEVCKPITNKECGNPNASCGGGTNSIGCNGACHIGTNTQKEC